MCHCTVLTDLVANAQVIFPNEKDVKVITALSSSGSLHYSSLVASDPKSASAHKVRFLTRTPVLLLQANSQLDHVGVQIAYRGKWREDS